MFRYLPGVTAILALLATPAFADDWQAAKLRGIVLQLVDNQWQPLQRGDIVSDTRVIRTTVSGHAEFTRGGETIDLEPNTQIQIFDKAHHQKPFTTVVQQFGTVSVEAQVQNVQHFAVETPYLAAVVKGTRFVVTANKTGGSVAVNRGHVAVTDKLSKTHTLLGVGQSAVIDKAATGGALVVQGVGQLPEVLTGSNQPVTVETSNNSGGIGLKLGHSKGDDGIDVHVGGNDGVSLKVSGNNGVSVNAGGLKIGLGNGNSGNGNSGNGNSGNGNSGNGNSGNGNSGNGNSGNGNSGNGNSGNGNSGNGNSGGGGNGGGLVNVQVGGIHLKL